MVKVKDLLFTHLIFPIKSKIKHCNFLSIELYIKRSSLDVVSQLCLRDRMSENRTFKLKIKLQKATFYGPSSSKYSTRQKIYITGQVLDPVIQNNQIVIKQGRRVSVNYLYDKLSTALQTIGKFEGTLVFLIDSSNSLDEKITDFQGNELTKFTTDSVCEQ